MDKLSESVFGIVMVTWLRLFILFFFLSLFSWLELITSFTDQKIANRYHSVSSYTKSQNSQQ